MSDAKGFLYTYKVTSGKFKGRTVGSFQNALFIQPNIPVSCFDNENEYLLYSDDLELIKSEPFNISYEELKKNGYMGSYEDFIRDCKSGLGGW